MGYYGVFSLTVPSKARVPFLDEIWTILSSPHGLSWDVIRGLQTVCWAFVSMICRVAEIPENNKAGQEPGALVSKGC